MKPVLAKTMIGSLEEFILQALAEGKQLDFGLVSFYPRLSGGLLSRDSDPTAEGLYVRGAVKARSALRDGVSLDAVPLSVQSCEPDSLPYLRFGRRTK